MKLVIQIPCYNEEEYIKDLLNSIPKTIEGVDETDIVVLDDGSFDKTAEIAKEFGAKIIKSDHIGLSKIFMKGVEYAIKNNADIMVNLDGDNQYSVFDIEKLIQPIINNSTDVTIGTRPIDKIKTFSFFKKFLQKFGTFVVKIISQTNIKDATSGFRAYNKKALLKMNIFNNYTYTIENIIQLRYKKLRIENIDINVNEQKDRKSKLIKNNFYYIFNQTVNLLRFFVIYSPVRFFSFISFLLFSVATVIGARFLYFYFNNQGTGHIQSLILCSIVFGLSFVVGNIAIIADIMSVNRKILEDMQEKLRQNK